MAPTSAAAGPMTVAYTAAHPGLGMSPARVLVLVIPVCPALLTVRGVLSQMTRCNIINGQTFQDFIRFQGLDDVLGVLAYNGVRSWLDVSNLDEECLFKLNTRLTGAGYGVGYVGVMRAAYIGVGQIHFGGFYQQCTPWLQPGLLSSIPEYPPGLEPHFWPNS